MSTADLEALRGDYLRLMERLAANEREFRRLGRAVWRVQEDERRRLARELHDGIGQNLTALAHYLSQLDADIPDGLRPRLQSAIALCRETLEDTREMSRLLRPPILDDLGLEPALRWLVRSVAEAASLAIELEVERLPAMDGELETLLFRIAQEALNNVAKHAQAHTVLVRLVGRGSMVLLHVADDGRGCDPRQALASGGSGIGGMRERLRLHGGTLELHSARGEGTRLRASVPVGVDGMPSA
jgi:signal transduction histidine kinase